MGVIRVQATTDMSRAIRAVIREYGGTAERLPDDVLDQFVMIVSAFALDLKAEQDRRADSNQEERSDG